jgi:hypothetical protein
MTLIDQIKEYAVKDVVKIIGYYVPLKPEGREWTGKCPFHNDHTPSLQVNPDKGIWKCFACGAGGRGGFPFVERIEGGDFFTSLRRVAEILNIDLPDGRRIRLAPREERVAPVDRPVFELKEWTDDELVLLGSPRGDDGRPLWTGKQIETDFSLFSVASYTLPPSRSSTTGQSVRRSAIETCPVFTFKYTRPDGSEWGRLYLPLNRRGSKFYHWPTGAGHRSDIYADSRLVTALEQAAAGRKHAVYKHVLICSGGSDAINAYMNLYEDDLDEAVHVCWLGSETQHLPLDVYCLLRSCAENIYICYDQDETGIARMHRIALQYPEIRIVNLPRNMNASTLGRCKDIRDFFKSFSYEGSKTYDFRLWMYTSQCIRFWEAKKNNKGEENGKYALVTSSAVQFAHVNGISVCQTAGGEYYYVRVKGNVVSIIQPDDIEPLVKGLMREYIRSNKSYYNIEIVEAIFKTKLFTSKNLRLIDQVELNFSYLAAQQQYFVFRNGIFRVTAQSVEAVTPAEAAFYVFERKIIPNDFTLQEKPFRVRYSARHEALRKLRDEATFASPEREQADRQIRELRPVDRYELDITLDGDTLSFVRFVYNTGRVYWQKEKRGETLTADERAEHDLNFINKCWCIGYLLRKYKDVSNACAILAVETEVMIEGESEGRTGKSLFGKYLREMISLLAIEMRNVDFTHKGDNIFAGVREDITDVVMLNDLDRGQGLHRIFNAITDGMNTRRMYQDTYTIPFDKSPKLYITSNYIPKLDGSSRGRLVISAFSNYYHADTPGKGLREFNPQMEFGHNLVEDYSLADMNRLYNFFIACVQLNMTFPEKIMPVMDRIELRSIQEELGSKKIFEWFEKIFAPDGDTPCVDTAFWRDDMMRAYRQGAYSVKEYGNKVKPERFRANLEKYCAYKGWIPNPEELYRNQTERLRREYRKQRETPDGERCDGYFWFIQTRPLTPEIKACFRDNSIQPLKIEVEENQ